MTVTTETRASAEAQKATNDYVTARWIDAGMIDSEMVFFVPMTERYIAYDNWFNASGEWTINGEWRTWVAKYTTQKGVKGMKVTIRKASGYDVAPPSGIEWF